MDDIVSSITEEETRLADSKENEQKGIDARTALSMQNNRIPSNTQNWEKKKLFCEKCQHEGHTIDRCYKLHGYPPGWKIGRSQPRGAHGGKWNQANHTKPEVESGKLLRIINPSSNSLMAHFLHKVPLLLILVFISHLKV